MFTRLVKISFVMLLAAATAYAAPPSRQFNYETGSIISSDEVTSNEDVIFNYLSAGVDTFLDGSIVNADVNSAANIQSDKLNLTSIAQAVLINSGGTFEVDGVSNFDGAVDFDSTIDFSGATITAQATFANLVATTADINGGTVDGAVIGGSSAANGTFTNLTANTTFKLGSTNQGDVLYDNGTSIVRLTPGSSGHFLKTNGAGANPAWAAAGSWILEETSTFTTASSVSITETISAGDVYMIIFEGTVNTDTFEPGLRINNNSSSNNYRYAYNGVYSINGGAAAAFDITGADTKVLLNASATYTLWQVGSFFVQEIITARSSGAQIKFESMNSGEGTGIGGGGEDIITSEGAAFVDTDVGTPTSVELVRISGTGTVTGRYYVLRLRTS